MASKNNDLKITISNGVTLIGDLIAALNAHTEALNRATAATQTFEKEKITQPDTAESATSAPVVADTVSSTTMGAVVEGVIQQNPQSIAQTAPSTVAEQNPTNPVITGAPVTSPNFSQQPVSQQTPIAQPTAQAMPQNPQQAVNPNAPAAYPQTPSTPSQMATPVANPSLNNAPMTSTQGVQPAANAAGPVPANGAAMPATAPTASPTNATAPTQTATVDPTLNAISVEGARLVEAGKMAQLQALLQKFGVVTITQLRQEQYAAFAAEMRALGANI